MEHFIPLSAPNLTGNELTYVTDAIKNEWVSTAGSYIVKFEEKLATYLHMPAVAACQSGTAGLHLALLAKKVDHTQAVIVPALTFIAAVNPVSYVNASPIFMDCDDSLCIDIEKLTRFFEQECIMKGEKLIHIASQKHVSALILVHVFGNMPDMESFIDLSRKYHVALIEDATEALGTRIKNGRYAGKYAGTIGDIGVYSFNGNKIITTGGGGAIVAQNADELDYMRYLSTQAKNDTFAFVHNEIGYNYRMTNIQAAVGLGQMEQLNTFIQTKEDNYFAYQQKGITLHPFSQNIQPNYWFYSYLCNQRDACIAYLKSFGIQTRPIWHLIHDLPPYQNALAYHIKKAWHYFDKVVNIPCSSNLTPENVAYVSDKLIQFEKGQI